MLPIQHLQEPHQRQEEEEDQSSYLSEEREQNPPSQYSNLLTSSSLRIVATAASFRKHKAIGLFFGWEAMSELVSEFRGFQESRAMKEDLYKLTRALKRIESQYYSIQEKLEAVDYLKVKISDQKRLLNELDARVEVRFKTQGRALAELSESSSAIHSLLQNQEYYLDRLQARVSGIGSELSAVHPKLLQIAEGVKTIRKELRAQRAEFAVFAERSELREQFQLIAQDLAAALKLPYGQLFQNKELFAEFQDYKRLAYDPKASYQLVKSSEAAVIKKFSEVMEQERSLEQFGKWIDSALVLGGAAQLLGYTETAKDLNQFALAGSQLLKAAAAFSSGDFLGAGMSVLSLVGLFGSDEGPDLIAEIRESSRQILSVVEARFNQLELFLYALSERFTAFAQQMQLEWYKQEVLTLEQAQYTRRVLLEVGQELLQTLYRQHREQLRAQGLILNYQQESLLQLEDLSSRTEELGWHLLKPALQDFAQEGERLKRSSLSLNQRLSAQFLFLKKVQSWLEETAADPLYSGRKLSCRTGEPFNERCYRALSQVQNLNDKINLFYGLYQTFEAERSRKHSSQLDTGVRRAGTRAMTLVNPHLWSRIVNEVLQVLQAPSFQSHPDHQPLLRMIHNQGQELSTWLQELRENKAFFEGLFLHYEQALSEFEAYLLKQRFHLNEQSKAFFYSKPTLAFLASLAAQMLPENHFFVASSVESSWQELIVKKNEILAFPERIVQRLTQVFEQTERFIRVLKPRLSLHGQMQQSFTISYGPHMQGPHPHCTASFYSLFICYNYVRNFDQGQLPHLLELAKQEQELSADLAKKITDSLFRVEQLVIQVKQSLQARYSFLLRDTKRLKEIIEQEAFEQLPEVYPVVKEAFSALQRSMRELQTALHQVHELVPRWGGVLNENFQNTKTYLVNDISGSVYGVKYNNPVISLYHEMERSLASYQEEVNQPPGQILVQLRDGLELMEQLLPKAELAQGIDKLPELLAALEQAQNNNKEEFEKNFQALLTPAFVQGQQDLLKQELAFQPYSLGLTANTPALQRTLKKLDQAYLALAWFLKLAYQDEFGDAVFIPRVHELWQSEKVVQFLTRPLAKETKPQEWELLNQLQQHKENKQQIRNFFLAHIDTLKAAPPEARSAYPELQTLLQRLTEWEELNAREAVEASRLSLLMEYAQKIQEGSVLLAEEREDFLRLAKQVTVKGDYFHDRKQADRWLFALAEGAEQGFYFIKELERFYALKLLTYHVEPASKEAEPFSLIQLLKPSSLPELVHQLLQKGALLSPWAHDEHYRTVLHLAAARGERELLQLLITHYDYAPHLFRPGRINAEAKLWDLPLMSALHEFYLNKNPRVETSIHYLRKEMAKNLVLLEGEVPPDQSYLDQTAYLKKALAQGQSLCHLAAAEGDYIFVRQRYEHLLQSQVDRKDVAGHTPLTLALEQLSLASSQQKKSALKKTINALVAWTTDQTLIALLLQSAKNQKWEVVMSLAHFIELDLRYFSLYQERLLPSLRRGAAFAYETLSWILKEKPSLLKVNRTVPLSTEAEEGPFLKGRFTQLLKFVFSKEKEKAAPKPARTSTFFIREALEPPFTPYEPQFTVTVEGEEAPCFYREGGTNIKRSYGKEPKQALIVPCQQVSPFLWQVSFELAHAGGLGFFSGLSYGAVDESLRALKYQNMLARGLPLLSSHLTLYLLNDSISILICHQAFQLFLRNLGFSSRQTQGLSLSLTLALSFYLNSPSSTLEAALVIIEMAAELLGSFLGEKVGRAPIQAAEFLAPRLC